MPIEREVAPGSAANTVAGDRDRAVIDGATVEPPVKIDSITAADEAIVPDFDIGEAAEIVVQHDCRGLAVGVGNHVARNIDVLSAIYLYAVEMGIGAAAKRMDDIVADDGRPDDVDAVFGVMDIVAQETAKAVDRIYRRAGTVNFAILQYESGGFLGQLKSVPRGFRYQPDVLQRDIARLNDDVPVNFQIADDGAVLGDGVGAVVFFQSYTGRNADLRPARPAAHACQFQHGNDDELACRHVASPSHPGRDWLSVGTIL